MLTVLIVLALGGLVCAVLSAMGKCPVWVAPILLALYALIEQIPIGDK